MRAERWLLEESRDEVVRSDNDEWVKWGFAGVQTEKGHFSEGIQEIL